MYDAYQTLFDDALTNIDLSYAKKVDVQPSISSPELMENMNQSEQSVVTTMRTTWTILNT